MMKLHRFWCLELSEFETVYKRKDVSSLKRFVTCTHDVFRLPYTRLEKEYPRQCILVGTTNQPEILSDTSGKRRLWIIPVQGLIPTDQLHEERDQIWAVASALYELGEPWSLSTSETGLQEKSIKDSTTHAAP